MTVSGLDESERSGVPEIVTTTDDGSTWQSLQPVGPHPVLRPRRMQVSPPPQSHPPPPVAVELEVATTDMWCHTNS